MLSLKNASVLTFSNLHIVKFPNHNIGLTIFNRLIPYNLLRKSIILPFNFSTNILKQIKMIKNVIFLSAMLLFSGFRLQAASGPDEGMWLPMYLKSLNEKDMKSAGLKLTADDIYSINKSSLKDAA